MLREFLENPAQSVEAVWYKVMPGVRACRFSLSANEAGASVELPVTLAPKHYESLFCCRGSMTVERQNSGTLTVSPQELFLLSDASSLLSVKLSAPMSGILVEADGINAAESLTTLCHLLGDLELYTDNVRQMMREREGCALLRSTPWSRHVFTALDALPADEQGRYCVLKTLDLLYLLCIRSPLLENGSESARTDSYLARTVAEIRTYMENHLDDKLTIDELSHQFHISPTAFKCNFRRLYGQPVHRWLQSQRMRRASELLCTSPVTILQIAQAVGYEGVSQFNVAFKRQFGMTPMQYRKKSDSGEI